MYLYLSHNGPVTAVGFNRLFALSTSLRQESGKADSAEVTERFFIGSVMAGKFHHRGEERTHKEAKSNTMLSITSLALMLIDITL